MASRLLLVIALAACATEPRFDGPLPVRNQHPAQLSVLHMDPTRAAPLPTGGAELRLNCAYSSLFLGGNASGDTFVMDGEILRTALGARVALSERVELFGELPFAHSSGGFLDEFVIDYHDAFSLPDQGRTNAARDAFRVRATRHGTTVYEMQPESLQILDVPLGALVHVLPGLAVRGALELPTGDDERGYGSGGVESSLGVVGGIEIGCLALHAHAQHAFARTPGPARRAGFAFRDVSSLGLGAELAASDELTLLVQSELETSTLRGLAPRQAAHDQALLWTGGRLRVSPGVALEVAFGEDLTRKTSPDFTAWLACVVRLGPSRAAH